MQAEQDGWVSLLSSNLQESLSLSGGGVDNKSFDTSFLRPEESEFAKSLESSQDVIGTARRIVKRQGADIEFQMDQLTDGVHKLRQYGETADRLAGRILEGANCTLAEREARLRQASGTEALPIQEVLRSLSRVDR
jgi:kinetochore protein Mis13/DSN1